MNFCILGAGAWGTAMALHLNRCGHSVTLVPRRYEAALDLASNRENTDYLPGYKLPHSIQIASEVGPALMEAEVICLACPSKGLRALCRQIQENREGAWQIKLLIVLCKGLELESLKTPTEVVREYFPDLPCGVLSGPTFAGDVAAGLPAAITLALANEPEEAERYQSAFSSKTLRIYRSSDLRGTEFGGTLKNIYAIASGLCDGLRLGDNAKAALLTRSLNEMVQLGVHLGGHAGTFYGLSGFGDLVATCSGPWSRNRTFGQKIGEGSTPAAIMEDQKSVVEGYRATRCLKNLCDENGLQPPILFEIYAILYENKSPQDALEALMARELKVE